MAAAELVDERFTDFRAPQVDAPTLIAEDFFHVGAILGPAVANWHDMDLAALAGRTTIDGVVQGEGCSADVMGHPFAALAWLANRLAGFGLGLKQGDTVLTGSVVVTQYPDGPAQVTTEIVGLGRVEIVFS
jgi:2-oxo-3-hexenedioate decarboxylase/2-keto-4-pentenoate hydratase